jgi:tetratricopeptide (TPR) repeat protein
LANNRNAWTEVAFATIKDILQNRNVEVPEQHIQNGDTGLKSDKAQSSAETKSIAQEHFDQSYSLWKKSRYQEAMEQCDQALALAPGWSKVHNLRGVILDEMQQIDQSILEYRKAIRLLPQPRRQPPAEATSSRHRLFRRHSVPLWDYPPIGGYCLVSTNRP